MPGNHLPRTKTGRALLGLDMTPEEGYWESLTLTNERSRAILAIEEEAAALDVDRLREAIRRADETMACMWSYSEQSRTNQGHTCAVQASNILRAALAVSPARDRVGTEEPGPEMDE